jgi:hypothetical protein
MVGGEWIGGGVVQGACRGDGAREGVEDVTVSSGDCRRR